MLVKGATGLLGDENSNNTRVKRRLTRDAEASWHLVAPFILNKHIHPFGIINPKNHCYMNSVIQLLFSILRTISHNFQFDSSTGGSISKFLFEIARSASSSTDVDALKFGLVQYKFYSGEQQEDASECLIMPIELINKGSVPYCGSNDNNSTGVSLSEILFSFMLEKYIVCNAWWLRSPSFESSSVLYITPTCTSSMQELITQGMEQKWEKSCFRCKNTWHVESNYTMYQKLLYCLCGNVSRECMNWLHNGFRTRTGGWEVWLLPWRWHILSIPLKAGRGISAETCGLDDVFPPDDIGSGPCAPFIIYTHYSRILITGN